MVMFGGDFAGSETCILSEITMAVSRDGILRLLAFESCTLKINKLNQNKIN